MDRQRNKVSAVALVALLVVVFGCGGSGGGDDAIVPPTTCVSFAPAADPGAASQVTTAVGASSCAVVDVVVRLENVPDVFGVFFDVVYDPAIVRFDAGSFDDSTSFLNSGPGSATCLAGDPNGVGRLVVGCTVLGGSGVDFPADAREVVTLPFRKTGPTGGSTFRFENESIVNSLAQPIAGVTWSDGGAFTVR